ncbi:hypothetical protein AALP_AAs52028U000100 [Arabis alpina]|uniref:Uncharacterized protein n=1 Tax=Arabis alpina TaxID=50452 RepID=A0A087FY19_ARAAL|nr:hypothetical protein AALP_AAs52028U000100 [Arabis alpina]
MDDAIKFFFISNSPRPKLKQIKKCGAYVKCPNFSYRIDNSNVLISWTGLPKAKSGIGGSQPHMLIEDYTHPQNLPGANKHGVSVFFFQHKGVLRSQRI